MKKLFAAGILIIFVSLFFLKNTNAAEDDFVNIKADNVEYVFTESQEVGVFSGNVSLVQEDFQLYGDKLKVYSAEGRIVGEGNIRIFSEDENWKFNITSGNGEYKKTNQYAMVTDSPKLVIIDKTKNNREITVTGSKMEMFIEKNEAVITGNVHILESQIEAWSDRAVFFTKEKKLVLTENAKVVQKKNEFSAAKITFFMDDNKIIMNENVQGRVAPEKQEAEGKK